MAKEALNIEEFEEEDFDEVSSEEEIDADVDVEDVPDGGIGDFVMSDEDLDAVYGEDDEDLDDERVSSLPAIAARMAEYGRNEDDTLAHVATGELVIPAQFLKDDVIKQRIYDILSEAGVDNPEAYVVGADENDLNPDTGLPEFFLKKIFKGIGKAIKGVVKVVKKALPVVLPIALSAFGPLGPVFGAALGSGIGTLVSGGSIGDALKSGLMSGAAGGIFAGFSGNTGSFMGNLREATGGIGERFSQFGTGIKEGAQNLASGDVGGFFDSVSGEYVPAAATDTTSTVADAVANADAVADVTRTVTVNSGDSLSKIAAQQGITVDDLLKLNPRYIDNPNFINVGDVIKLPSVSTGAGAGEGLISRTVNFAKENPIKSLGIGVALTAASGGLDSVNADPLDPKFTTTGDMLLRDRPEDYMVNSLGNLVLDGKTLTYITSEERDRRERERNKVGGENIPPAISQVQGYQGPNLSTPALTIKEGVGRPFYKPTDAARTLPNYMAKDIYGAPIYRPGDPRDVGQGPVFVSSLYDSPEFYPAKPALDLYPNELSGGRGMADGGHVFPRRNGGISPDEGIAGKDSVKAMLMPGEFVMTTKAVRGLGNGDLNNGIKNMYSVMRNLEKRGRAA